MKNYILKTLAGSSILAVALCANSSSALAFNLTINPPPSLWLDGMNIESGTFNLTNAWGYDANGTPIAIPGTPVSHAATIGSTDTHTLLTGIDDSYQALRLEGYFDAIVPDKDLARFDILLTGINGNGTGDFTYFLPSTTNGGNLVIYQTTDLGADTTSDNSLADNMNVFSTAAPIISVVNGVVVATPPPQSIVTSSRGNFCAPAPSQLNLPSPKFHGGGGGTPPGDCVPVPEPLTMLGSAVALGFGGLFQRKKYQNKNKVA
jgi:hypothetical protein